MGQLAGTLLRIAVPVLVGAALLWTAAQTTWLLPVRTAVLMRRRGERVTKELAARAYRATIRTPLRALLLRTGLWTGSAGLVGLFLVQYAGWPLSRVAELTALAGLHAYVLSALRAAVLATILQDIRTRLFTVLPPLRRFTDGYFRRLVLVSMVVTAGTVGAQAAFLYYFLPVANEQYLQVETMMPVAAALGLAMWILVARRATRSFHGYLEATQGEGDPAGGLNATAVFRRAQALPYRLALTSVVIWAVISMVTALVARFHLSLETDDTVVLMTAVLVVAVGASIYEALWHAETMRPLLSHLMVRYRVPVRGIAPSLSLRSKLLLSFGSVVLLACGLALLWGFVQYKNLATVAVTRQADLGLAWLRSEIQAEVAASGAPPSRAGVKTALRRIASRAPEASAVLYYLEDDGDYGTSARRCRPPRSAAARWARRTCPGTSPPRCWPGRAAPSSSAPPS
jgi:hypothetical protein